MAGERHSKPIACPRPPQTRAAPFKSLYRKRAGQRLCHSGDWSRRRASDTALRLRGPQGSHICKWAFPRNNRYGLPKTLTAKSQPAHGA